MSGEAGGQGGQGTGGAGAGAGGAGAAGGGTGGDAGTGGTGGTGSAGAAAPAWHGLTAPEDAAYIQNKGWTAAKDVIASYRGAEKLIGRDPSTLMVMPRADDAEGIRGVFSKLGMPATADKYDLPLPKDADPAYATWAKETFHKAGLTVAQAKELTAANNAYFAKVQADQEAAYKSNLTVEKSALMAEWKGGFERMMGAATTAAHALGFSDEMIDAIESQIGYANTMKFFANLGVKLGEDNFESGDGSPRFNGTMTPDEAKAEWAKFSADPSNKAALFDNQHPGHKAAKARQTELFAIMYG